MQYVTFTFSADAPPDAQEKALCEVRTWNGVLRADRVKPDSSRPEIRLMGYVHLEDGVDPAAFVKALRAHTNVETASVPAKRFAT